MNNTLFKCKLWLALLLVLSCSLCLSSGLLYAQGSKSAGLSPNLLEDPSFEQKSPKWNLPANVTTVVSNMPYEGRNSVHFTNANAKTTPPRITQNIAISAGKTIRFNVWVKGKNIDGSQAEKSTFGARVYIQSYDSAGKLINGSYPQTLNQGTFDWMQLAGIYTVPANATNIAIGIGFMPGVTGEAWFDNAAIHIEGEEKSNFNVSSKKKTYKVGEPVEFFIAGDADYITFYSGAKGEAYEDRYTKTATPQLKFDNIGKFGTQLNTLSLLVSSDFNGHMSKNDINAATWTDITNRVNLSKGTKVSSGAIDLSDFVKQSPVYIAFKYLAKDLPTPQKSWWISNLSLNSIAANGLILPIVPTLADASWKEYSIEGPDRKWRITVGDLYIGENINKPSNEDWVISKPIDLLPLNPRIGLRIKDLSSSVKSYMYIYSEPGTYKAVFKTSNGNPYSTEGITKELIIKIEKP